MKKFKEIPDFKTEDEERDFWATHSSVDYIDWSKAKRIIVSDRKPVANDLSIRMPKWLVHSLKSESRKKDVPYESFVKSILTQAVKK